MVSKRSSLTMLGRVRLSSVLRREDFMNHVTAASTGTRGPTVLQLAGWMATIDIKSLGQVWCALAGFIGAVDYDGVGHRIEAREHLLQYHGTVIGYRYRHTLMRQGERAIVASLLRSPTPYASVVHR